MVFSSSFGFHFVIFNQALLFVVLQLLTYEIADELGKEKLEPEGNLRENGDNTVEKSHYAPPDFIRISLGKQDIRCGHAIEEQAIVAEKKRRAFIAGKTPVR